MQINNAHELPIFQPKGFPTIPEDWEVKSSFDKGIFSIWYQKKNLTYPAKRGLFIVHGMGEYGGRYAHFPHYLKKTFDCIVAFDLRGHGRSEGLRGHIESFDVYVTDLLRQIEIAKSKIEELHVFAHSMGALIMIKALLENQHLPLRSVTLSAPFLAIKMQVPLLKRWVGSALTHIWGTLQLTSAIDPSVLSQDPELCEHYATDRLVHDKATPRWYTNLLRTQAEVRKQKPAWEYAVQFLVPLDDSLVDAREELLFFDRIQSKDKRLIQYPNARHEAFNDINKDQVFKDIEEWILKHA